ECCAPYLTRFGGHAGAAGMSLPFGALDAFRAAFVAEATRQLGTAVPSTALAVDAEVTLRDLDIGFAEELGRLAPFGVANREPLFALSGVTTRATRVVGKDHLQLTLDDGGATGD